MKSVQPDREESNLPKELAAPARRALAGAGYTRLEQLTKVSEAEIKKLHGIGPNALHVLAADALTGPFEPLQGGPGEIYLEQPRLAISGHPAAGGSTVVLAGLRNLSQGNGMPFAGDLVIVSLSDPGSAVHIQTPRPVRDVKWGTR